MDSVNNIKAGDTIVAGENIGNTGNTGASTGAHLHIDQYTEKQPDDYESNPEKYLKKSYEGGKTYVYFTDPQEYKGQ